MSKSYRQIILEEIRNIEDRHKNDPPKDQAYWRKIINTLVLDLKEYENRTYHLKQKGIIPVGEPDFFQRVWELIEKEFFGEI